MSEYHDRINRRSWEMRTNLTTPKRQAKKSHEQIERELAEFESRGGTVTELEGPVLQPSRRVGVRVPGVYQ